MGYGYGYFQGGLSLGSNVNQFELPDDYWQEEDTEYCFLEEETKNILTLEDL